MVISEEDRLKLQLLNSMLSLAEANIQMANLKADNAKMHTMMSQKELEESRQSVTVFLEELKLKYTLNAETDTVDLVTGEIKRGSNEEGQKGKPTKNKK